jgi:hypothetical protein
MTEILYIFYELIIFKLYFSVSSARRFGIFIKKKTTTNCLIKNNLKHCQYIEIYDECLYLYDW